MDWCKTVWKSLVIDLLRNKPEQTGKMTPDIGADSWTMVDDNDGDDEVVNDHLQTLPVVPTRNLF